MTKIPLDDPIWSRLYGPYSLTDVAGRIRILSDGWDEAVARQLCWDDLHHQSDLYPSTYAALPWLWKIAPRTFENLAIFSWIIACSEGKTSSAGQFRGPFRGLSLTAGDHAHHWLPADFRLTEKDMERLRQLHDWFQETAMEMVQACVAGLTLARQPSHFSHLLAGWFGVRGNGSLDQILEQLAQGEDFEEMAEEWGPMDSGDVSALDRAASLIEPCDPDFARLIADYTRYLEEHPPEAG